MQDEHNLTLLRVHRPNGPVPHGRDLAAECRRAAEAAVRDAQPLKRNGYKIPLLRGVIEEALSSLA